MKRVITLSFTFSLCFPILIGQALADSPRLAGYHILTGAHGNLSHKSPVPKKRPGYGHSSDLSRKSPRPNQGGRGMGQGSNRSSSRDRAAHKAHPMGQKRPDYRQRLGLGSSDHNRPDRTRHDRNRPSRGQSGRQAIDRQVAERQAVEEASRQVAYVPVPALEPGPQPTFSIELSDGLSFEIGDGRGINFSFGLDGGGFGLGIGFDNGAY
ncbi:MAG: hypothetical protein LBJ61_11755 [Deltaproteobacteria bacterium]|jgi:hypothetical protein|nr:hypothetical protein [Deltaproteobacteria bacterium]